MDGAQAWGARRRRRHRPVPPPRAGPPPRPLCAACSLPLSLAPDATRRRRRLPTTKAQVVGRLLQRRQAADGVAVQVHPQQAAALGRQRPVVAVGLGGDQAPEGVGGLRDREVGVGVVHDLEEQAAVGASLVELPGGVQEPGPEPHRGGDAEAVARREAQPLQRGLGLWRRGDECLDRQVAAGLGLGQEAGQRRAQRRVGGGHGGYGPAPGLARHGPGGQRLGQLHVGLVEGVDAQHAPCHGGGHLPAVHLGAEVGETVQAKPHHRVPGGLEGAHRRRLGLVGVAGHREVHEQAVVAVRLRRPGRLAGHGEDAGAVLAGALRHQLLDPGGQGGEGG